MIMTLIHILRACTPGAAAAQRLRGTKSGVDSELGGLRRLRLAELAESITVT